MFVMFIINTFMNFLGEDTKSLLKTFMCAGLTSSSFSTSGKIPAELKS